MQAYEWREKRWRKNELAQAILYFATYHLRR